jgi:uncharacterized protein (TIGR03067 family)
MACETWSNKMTGRCLIVMAMWLAAAGCSRTGSAAPVSQAATPPAAANDLDQIQGRWRIESSKTNGVEDPAVVRTVTVLFEGNRFILIDRDGGRMEETIELKSERTPKAIDRWTKDSTKPVPGIYTIEGNRLRWCSAMGGNKTRPAAFESKPGSRQSLLVLKRQQK